MSIEEITDFTLKAPAKINLALAVTGRRGDGYHTVETVMQTIGLYDVINIRIKRGGIRRKIYLSCSDENVPLGPENLAYRAAELFYDYTRLTGECDIYIEKNIPLSAGLGGGSSDAAAVLRALSILNRMEISTDEMCKVGLRLGADVPFFFHRQTMLAEGIGEKLTRLPYLSRHPVVLCKPDFGISAKEAYDALDRLGTPFGNDVGRVVMSLVKQDYAELCSRLFNHLEVVAQEHMEILEIKAAMLEYGALGAIMSGSGPTVFGMFDNDELARSAQKELSKKYKETFLTENE